MKIIIYLLIAFASVVYLTGCSCACGEPDDTEVPSNVLRKANEFIIAQTGREFFENYINPDFKRTQYAEPNYHLVYRLIMPEKPYVNEVISFTVDSEGNVVESFDVAGIPNCFERGNACDFSVTKEQAIQIAKDAGLEDGIIDWKTGFMWNAKMNKYVWHILSTTSETKVEGEFRGSGSEIIIDPNTGEVLAKNDWHVR